MAFNEIVLGAFLQGLRGQRPVVQTRQHHQRDAGRDGMGPFYRSQLLCIGQAQIKHDDVNRVLRQMLLRVNQALDLRYFGLVRALLVQHFAQQTLVPKAVFDQVKYFDRFLRHPHVSNLDLYFCCGNLILTSQKSLTPFSRASKASNCTGLTR